MHPDLKERCLQYCKHIEAVSGVSCALAEVRDRSTERPSTCTCGLRNKGCDASGKHLLYRKENGRERAKEEIRHCSRGLTFLATPLHKEDGTAPYCLITGPIIISEFGKGNRFEGTRAVGGGKSVPRMTKEGVQALGEMLRAACGYLAGEEILASKQAVVLRKAYELKGDSGTEKHPYAMWSERKLRHVVREGDAEKAKRLVLELLCSIYQYCGGDLGMMRARVCELLVVMSRAAIEGGADTREVFWDNDQYLKAISECMDIESMSHWVHTAAQKFTRYALLFAGIDNREVVSHITAYIKRNLTSKPTIGAAAAAVRLSQSHVSRILRRELGCTFTEYVNRLRIDHGKILMLDHRLSLGEVANALGFGDQSYFTKVFKKFSGVTPREYREQRLG